MVCPAPNDQVSRQPLTASPKLVTVTLARTPKVVEAPALMLALYGALGTVTVPVLRVRLPFRGWVATWPLPIVMWTVQPLMAPEVLLATVTSPWSPPGQLPTVR